MYRQARDESEDLASLQEIPKTEDFITFLCLRGESVMHVYARVCVFVHCMYV